MQVEIAFLITVFISASAQSIKQSVLEGNDLFVFCDGEMSPGGSVYWENSNLQYHYDGPILNITKIARDKSQYYECFDIDHSKNSTTQIFAAYVDVTYPAKILSKSYQDTLKENETFSAELTVEGNPKPEIRLTQKSNGAVAFHSNELGTFNATFKVKCSSMDTYILTCSNLLNYDEIYLNLTVLCVPRPDPGQTIIYTQTPRVGEFVKMEMFATGYPAPTFAWTHSGAPVQHVDDGYTSTVDVQGVKVEDFGNYSLTMSNSAGENTVVYFIEADGPPDSATDLQVGDITLNSATLSWQPGFDYDNIQTFTVQSSGQEIDTVTLKDHSLNRVNYTLNNLQHGSTYSMDVKSSNSKGNAAAPSNTVTFTTGSPTPPPTSPPTTHPPTTHPPTTHLPTTHPPTTHPPTPGPSRAPKTRASKLLVACLLLLITFT